MNILVEGKEALLIDSIDSNHQLRIVEPLGLRLPLHIGATRRVILAYLSKEQQEEYFLDCDWTPRTENSITNEVDLKQNLEKIKERGFAISSGETTIGTWGIAVPLFGVDGVEGSLSIATPDVRISDDVIHEYAELLLKKSQIISNALGRGKWIKENTFK